MKRSLSWVASVVAALLLLSYLTLLFIPNRAFKEMVTRGLAQQGYTFTATSFSKSFPLGLKASNVILAITQGPVVKAEKAEITMRLLPLLLGRIQFSGIARIGQGTLSMTYTATQGGTARLATDNILLQDIPFFQTFAGSRAKGSLRANATLAGLRKVPSGTVQLEVRQAELADIKVGGTPLPDAAYSVIQGKLAVDRGKAKLESFTLQGEGLYVRLKGEMPVINPVSAAPLNLTLELMPKPDFLEKQKFVFLLLTKYLDTPGHYLIPVRGTLGKPSIL